MGRFAPSPTGDLHLGSLVAALGSYLDARSHGGRWLLRMEDLDAARVVPGCDARMLRTLESFGLHWDGPVTYQSARTGYYAQALERLSAAGLTFECRCSRRERGTQGGYPGTCRARAPGLGPSALRFRVDDARTVRFTDRVQGECAFALRERGDVIVRRRDRAFAYQLAVVVDDALQGISDVVRGADLLDSTAWQLALQEALGLPRPRYAHLPLVVEPDGGKLAKSRRSIPLDLLAAAPLLYAALTLLQQDPPATLKSESVGRMLEWACGHWELERVRGLRQVAATG